MKWLMVILAALAPAELSNVGIDQRLNAQAPVELRFRDETGANVRLGDVFSGKPVLLVFAYCRCPMLCGLVLNGVMRSVRALSFDAGKQFQIVVVSFDPQDTPANAAAKKQSCVGQYRRSGADAGWHFLTGDEPAIRALTDAVGFRYAYDAEAGQFAHGSGVMVLTPGGKVSRYFYGIEYPTRDLKFGLIEAAQGQIGSRVDQLMLLCYRYDPATGKYGVAINRTLRAACIGTVAALGAFIGVMLQRERRR
jgi:protein SCO1/2